MDCNSPKYIKVLIEALVLSHEYAKPQLRAESLFILSILQLTYNS